MTSTTTITEFAHLQIPLAEISQATNNFAENNIIGSGDFGNVYKGKLMRDGKFIKFSARRMDQKRGLGDVEFWTEISVLSSHRDMKRIVRIIGFCNENGEKIIVNEHYAKGSLLAYVSNPILTWYERIVLSYEIVLATYGIHFVEGQSYHIIHRNISSSTILLDDHWHPRLSGFEFSIKQPADRMGQVHHCDALGTKGYIDPAIEKSGGVTVQSDIYSLGVVLLEILCGRKAYQDNELLVPLVKSHFEKGTLLDIVHPNLRNHINNPEPFRMLSEIAYHCLEEDPSIRPSLTGIMRIIFRARGTESVRKMSHRNHATEDENDGDGNDATEYAKYLWKENHKDPFRMSFEDVKLATQNFSLANKVGGGGFGSVYKGNIADVHGNGHNTIVAKKLDTSHGQGEREFYNELLILHEYRHENVIGLVGYSNETNEKLIVYEYASKGSLDKYLNNASITWRNRLEISIDVVTGLDFLHGGTRGKEVVIHRDIKTANILLFDDWKAKVGDFGLSLISTIDKETKFTIDRACGTMNYVDPQYLKSNVLTIESDIYSLGVVLFEILYGKAIYAISKYASWSLLNFIRHNVEEGKKDEMVFKGIKEEIVPESLNAFLNVVYKCLDGARERRPTSQEVLVELKKALELQEDSKR